MIWNRYFAPFIIVLSTVAFFHWIGTTELYYWTYFWYDIPMHFLGGAWVVLATLWISEMPPARLLKPFLSVMYLLGMALFVGVAWEVYEVVFGIADMHAIGYVRDTVLDLIMDTSGALIVALVWSRLRPRDIITSSRSS